MTGAYLEHNWHESLSEYAETQRDVVPPPPVPPVRFTNLGTVPETPVPRKDEIWRRCCFSWYEGHDMCNVFLNPADPANLCTICQHYRCHNHKYGPLDACWHCVARDWCQNVWCCFPMCSARLDPENWDHECTICSHFRCRRHSYGPLDACQHCLYNGLAQPLLPEMRLCCVPGLSGRHTDQVPDTAVEHGEGLPRSRVEQPGSSSEEWPASDSLPLG